MTILYFDHSHLRPSLQKALDAQLGPDELLVWTDQPRAAQLIERGLRSLIMPFIFGIFAAIPLLNGLRHFDTDLFFLLLTLFGAISAPIILFTRVTRMAYVLTNKRAMVISGTGKKTQVQSFLPKDLQTLDVKQNADGTGDIVFSSTSGQLWDPKTMSTPRNKNLARPFHFAFGNAQFAKHTRKKKGLISPGFYGLREVKRVESLLKALASSVQSAPPVETVAS